MEVIILKDSLAVANQAAEYLKKQIIDKPSSVLGLATGATPLKAYEKLVEWHKDERLDFSKVKTFNLDEYVGLDQEHPGSYSSYMRENLFSKINIPQSQTFIPNGVSQNISEECQSYEAKIREVGGVDLQILGIGRDGHIGFNEPSSSLKSRTRLKTLTEQTRKDNEKYFDTISEVPFHVLTMGIGTIMESRHIVLMAFGESKADAIARCVEGPVTAYCPASILQFHEKVTILVDEEAARHLKRKDYYNWVYQQKPDWQKNS